MKAMILAAGKGTRLRPLTNYHPKALIKAGDYPLLEIVISQLIHYGVDEVVINLHHFGEQIRQFLEKKNNFGITIHLSDEQDLLLDTGGALKRARPFLEGDDPFILCNTDILTDTNIRALHDFHNQSGSIASLAVRSRDTSRYLLANEEMKLAGWCNVKDHIIKTCKTGPGNLEMLAFSGIHIISPKIFSFMPPQDVFSIIDVYLQIAREHDINLIRHDEDQWMDVGTPEKLSRAIPLVESLMSKTEVQNS
ncbi:MAG: nucleotidyltransferase family protein [Saprospiraceae bacterium]|nr:nucleotidyltransferase family protein [Saprospiraceae bacterium]